MEKMGRESFGNRCGDCSFMVTLEVMHRAPLPHGDWLLPKMDELCSLVSDVVRTHSQTRLSMLHVGYIEHRTGTAAVFYAEWRNIIGADAKRSSWMQAVNAVRESIDHGGLQNMVKMSPAVLQPKSGGYR